MAPKLSAQYSALLTQQPTTMNRQTSRRWRPRAKRGDAELDWPLSVQRPTIDGHWQILPARLQQTRARRHWRDGGCAPHIRIPRPGTEIAHTHVAQPHSRIGSSQWLAWHSGRSTAPAHVRPQPKTDTRSQILIDQQCNPQPAHITAHAHHLPCLVRRVMER